MIFVGTASFLFGWYIGWYRCDIASDEYFESYDILVDALIDIEDDDFSINSEKSKIAREALKKVGIL